MKNKEEKLFHIEYRTAEDDAKEMKELVDKIDQFEKSDYIFNNEPIYWTGQGGHAFALGFYVQGITKSGISATKYASGKWIINNNDYDYDYKNNEFVIRVYEPVIETDWTSLEFPTVKNLSGPTGLKLPNTKPKEKP